MNSPNLCEQYKLGLCFKYSVLTGLTPLALRQSSLALDGILKMNILRIRKILTNSKNIHNYQNYEIKNFNCI